MTPVVRAGRKSCAITTAKRLAQFLGDERIKDKGLNCNYVIARRPDNQPTSERAIPVAIFSTEPAVARSFLRRWCGHLSSGVPRPHSRQPPPHVCQVMQLLCDVQRCAAVPRLASRYATTLPVMRMPQTHSNTRACRPGALSYASRLCP